MPTDFKRFKSTAISYAEYDSDTQELTITFANGNDYDLSGVPPDLWEGLKNAASAGQYFNTYLKGMY